MVFYNDKLKDTQKAIETCDKMIALYPTAGGEENAFAIKTKEALLKSLTKPSATKPANSAKPQK